MEFVDRETVEPGSDIIDAKAQVGANRLAINEIIGWINEMEEDKRKARERDEKRFRGEQWRES